nr:RNA-directed DNA polymerase, eukaryota [Tanacetum cinerariifolium]
MQTRSSLRLVSNPSSNPTLSTNPNPKGRNRRRSKERIEEFNLDELSPPIVTMVDQHTMAQLLQAPTEGYEDAIAQNGNIVPKSRTYQVQADLLHVCSYHEEAIKVEHQVWAAVADETVSAVRYGFKGIVPDKTLIPTGLLVKTWAHIPRGSGLGASSILAAAVVKGLLCISDGDESNENVARLVLTNYRVAGTATCRLYSSGYSFFYFEDEHDAEDAIHALDNSPFGYDIRRLSVEWARVVSFLSPSSDRWVCDLNGEGMFRVKDIRLVLDDMYLPEMSDATRWVKCVPIKVNMFTWRARRDQLPTRINLTKREWDSWFLSLRLSSTLKSLLKGVFITAW